MIFRQRFVPAPLSETNSCTFFSNVTNLPSYCVSNAQFGVNSLTPVSSTGPETHAKHCATSYVFELLRVFLRITMASLLLFVPKAHRERCYRTLILVRVLEHILP